MQRWGSFWGFVQRIYTCATLISVSLVMRIRTFTPDIVEAILGDTLPDHLTLFDIAVDPPALWEGQRTLMIIV
jgi:hypothetical protein